MSKKMIPTICGKPRLFVSEGGCSDCEYLEKRVKKLEECCDNVREELDSKIEQRDIKAGNNVTVVYNSDGSVTISSTGGGGDECTCTKSEILNCIGVREMDMSLADTDGNLEEWIVLGRLKDEQIGDGSAIDSCHCTKEQLLDILKAVTGEATLGGGLSPVCLIVGFIAAFLSGLFACKTMVALVRKAKLGWFALYCAIVAVLIFIIA